MVTYWCRKLKLKSDILVIRRGPGRPPEVDLDNAILDAFNKFPFHSLPSPSRVLKRPLSTIHDHFIRAGFVVKHLEWRLAETSVDGSNWTEADYREGNSDLNTRNITRVFAVSRSDACQYVRLVNIGPNHEFSESDQLLISGFEVFGQFIT
jgi:hypothetical protein